MRKKWRAWFETYLQMLTKYTKYQELKSLSCQSMKSRLQMFSKLLRMPRVGSPFRLGVSPIQPWRMSSSRLPVELKLSMFSHENSQTGDDISVSGRNVIYKNYTFILKIVYTIGMLVSQSKPCYSTLLYIIIHTYVCIFSMWEGIDVNYFCYKLLMLI